jgi:oxygen-independent coproporphyrinogen-3 oxidase
LIAEINGYKELAAEYLVKTIFFGGGTPSSIDGQYIMDIMEAIKRVFTVYGINDEQAQKKGFLGKLFGGSDKKRVDNSTMVERKEADDKIGSKSNDKAEITIEVNPGTLSEEKLNCYKEAGVNRLSIGLQSTDNDELRLLGRIHSYEEFEENYWLARKLGFDNINIDLISALPGQTLEFWLSTVAKVVALKPEHISAYS